jgi:hypothetical protein
MRRRCGAIDWERSSGAGSEGGSGVDSGGVDSVNGSGLRHSIQEWRYGSRSADLPANR